MKAYAMPYDFHWHDTAETIIRVDIHGDVTWDGFYEVCKRVVDEVGQKPYRVDLIFNDSVGMPKGNPMPHLKKNMERFRENDNMGLVCSVVPRTIGAVVDAMINMTTKIYKMDAPENGLFFETLDEALEVIRQDRTHKEPAADE